MTPTKTLGRPTAYSIEIAEQICAEIASRVCTMADVCTAEGMPDRATVFRWMAKHPDFRNLYERARELQSEIGYDDMAEIAGAPLPEVEVFDLSGKSLGHKVDAGVSMAEMQRRKLQIDIIKFKLVKLQPKRFGDNKNIDLNVNHSHKISSEQFTQLLATAAAPPQIAAPEDDEPEYTEFTETEDDDIAGMTADEFDELIDDYM